MTWWIEKKMYAYDADYLRSSKKYLKKLSLFLCVCMFLQWRKELKLWVQVVQFENYDVSCLPAYTTRTPAMGLLSQRDVRHGHSSLLRWHPGTETTQEQSTHDVLRLFPVRSHEPSLLRQVPRAVSSIPNTDNIIIHDTNDVLITQKKIVLHGK